jgi:hypothetical protein
MSDAHQIFHSSLSALLGESGEQAAQMLACVCNGLFGFERRECRGEVGVAEHVVDHPPLDDPDLVVVEPALPGSGAQVGVGTGEAGVDQESGQLAFRARHRVLIEHVHDVLGPSLTPFVARFMEFGRGAA